LWRASILPHTDDGIPEGRAENEKMVDMKHVEIKNKRVDIVEIIVSQYVNFFERYLKVIVIEQSQRCRYYTYQKHQICNQFTFLMKKVIEDPEMMTRRDWIAWHTALGGPGLPRQVARLQ